MRMLRNFLFLIMPALLSTSVILPAIAQNQDSFVGDGKVITSIGSMDEASGMSVAIQPDRKILFGGYSFNGDHNDFALVRYNYDGSLDASFGKEGKVTTAFGLNAQATSVALQKDGKILLGGFVGGMVDQLSCSGQEEAAFALARYNADGRLDTSFDGDGLVRTSFGTDCASGYKVVIQSDGKIILAGPSLNSGGPYKISLVRYDDDGMLDTGFGDDGVIITNVFGGPLLGMVIQADGKIVLGSIRDSSVNDKAVNLVRYNNNGSLDTSFGNDGYTTTPNNNLLGYDIALSLQPDGKILVAGTSVDYTMDFILLRYDINGRLDNTFDGDGIVTTNTRGSYEFHDEGRSVAVQNDGKILLGGCRWDGVKSDLTIVRYNVDGSLDTNFSYAGIVSVNFFNRWCEHGGSVAIQSNDKILIGGTSNGKFAIARVNADGSLDTQNTTFIDVPPNNWAYYYINAIRDAGITGGCGNGNYCPQGLVTREQMAAFLVRAVEGEPADNYCGGSSYFSDVSPDSWSCRYIKRLAELNITGGCGQGNYCPQGLVTRDQMAAFIVRAVEGDPAMDYCGGIAPFQDVAPSAWSCRYIKRLAELNVTQGCAIGKYCPYDTVNREQMAAFLARAFLDMD